MFEAFSAAFCTAGAAAALAASAGLPGCCPPPLAWHGCRRGDRSTILYVNNFQVELLIINADSSEVESKQHLAARTFNENVIKEFRLRTTK